MRTEAYSQPATDGKALARAWGLAATLLVCVNWQALSAPAQYMVYHETGREPKGSITTWSATNSGDNIVFYLHNKTSGSDWVVNLQLPSGHESGRNAYYPQREPEGSKNTFFDCRDNPNIGFYLHNNTSGSNWISSGHPTGITLPYVLTDVDSGVTFLVEEDGRHVSATDPFGALLWYRDPFADAHLEPYRTRTPCIVRFDLHKRGPSDDFQFAEQMLHKKGINKFISISFNSSQTGFMDVTTGDFFFTGQL